MGSWSKRAFSGHLDNVVESIVHRHGLPSLPRFGEAITALIEVSAGQTADEAEVIRHVKSELAAYKAPKRVLEVPTLGRAASGKLDYSGLRSWAIAEIARRTA